VVMGTVEEIFLSISLKESLYPSVSNMRIVELRAELAKQGPMGWISLALGALGATGFFSWLYFTYKEYVLSNWLVCLLFFLLFVNSVITFSSRRQLAQLKDKSTKTENNSHTDEVESKAKGLEAELAKAKRELDDLTKKCQNEELKELIQPLYLAFDKYPDDPKVMQREKFGLPLIWSLMSPSSEKVEKYLGIEKADPIIEILQRYSNLAQPALRELIKQFLDFRQKQKEKGISMNDPYFIETADKVNQIMDLVTARYNELMWGDRES
jgi:hypothetical protein